MELRLRYDEPDTDVIPFPSRRFGRMPRRADDALDALDDAQRHLDRLSEMVDSLKFRTDDDDDRPTAA